jgi:hypothetical protein
VVCHTVQCAVIITRDRKLLCEAIFIAFVSSVTVFAIVFSLTTCNHLPEYKVAMQSTGLMLLCILFCLGSNMYFIIPCNKANDLFETVSGILDHNNDTVINY